MIKRRMNQKIPKKKFRNLELFTNETHLKIHKFFSMNLLNLTTER